MGLSPLIARYRLACMPAPPRAALGLLVLGMLACNAADDGPLPPDVQDPRAAQTPSGAMARYRGTLGIIGPLFDSLLTTTGMLTDELAALPAPAGVAHTQYTHIDSRSDLSEGFVATYTQLHRLRGEAQEAHGFLQAYAPDSSLALAGHMYAVEGYAETFLADLFCSGIPLSRVNFGEDYTLAAGSSTAEVYTHAVALFDTALALAGDSARIKYLAAVGRGRALLALGRYTEAAAAVAAVPDEYSYQLIAQPNANRLLTMFANSSVPGPGYAAIPGTPSAADNEGSNGLDYRSSGDPRTPTTAQPGTDPFGNTMYIPTKYLDAPVMMTMADGIEARLIEAEAALQAGSADWLTKLNALRTDGTFTTQPNGLDPAIIDTLWHAGTGSMAGLGPLDDPDNAHARVSLLFRERAFWLYLTAHRQGDLRRLVREYHRLAETVYPAGEHVGGAGAYGGQIVAPVPVDEQERNPKYTGCIDHHA